jgi:uncharacterized LabA/DUF88 family protein
MWQLWEGQMERVAAYIDGFNLYYGIKNAFGRKYLWLDVEALCGSVLLSTQTLVSVKYFTARVRGPADSQARQSTYLDALDGATNTVSIFGRLQLNKLTCVGCGASRTKPEEKKTDVAIATHIVSDAYEDRYDVALLVSGDSDMAPPVEVVSGLPGRRVVAAFPPRRKSDELKKLSSGSTSVSEASLRQSQFAPELILPSGVKLCRPPTWR